MASKGRPRKNPITDDTTSGQEPNTPDHTTEEGSDITHTQPDSTIQPIAEEHLPIQMPIEDDLTKTKSSSPMDDANDDIPDDFEPDPLAEPIKENSYTDGMGGASHNPPPTDGKPPIPEPIIPEPPLKSAPSNANDVVEEIKGSMGSGSGKTGGGPGSGSGGKNTTGTGTGTSGGPKPPPRDNPNPRLDDLSPTQKRKAAEQAADALLLTYGQVAPIPFKWASKYNTRKLQQMDMDNLIDLNDPLDDEGSTIKSYTENVNQQYDQVFEITDEMKSDIRGPLVDVLLENNIAMTAAQRLMMAVGGQLLQMGILAGRAFMQNRADMQYFKDRHKENKEMHMKGAGQTQTQQAYTQHHSPSPQATATSSSSPPPSSPPPLRPNRSTPTPDSPISPPPMGPRQPDPPAPVAPNNDPNEDIPDDNSKLEEFLAEETQIHIEKNNNKEEEIASVENGGITVEEFIEEDPKLINPDEDLDDFIDRGGRKIK